MNRHRLLLLCSTVLLLFVRVPAPPIPPTPSPTPPALYFNTYIYDSQHAAGIVKATALPGERTEVTLSGAVLPDISETSLNWERNAGQVPGIAAGRSYTFRIVSPMFGTVGGTGYVGALLHGVGTETVPYEYPVSSVLTAQGGVRGITLDVRNLSTGGLGPRNILHLLDLMSVDSSSSPSLALAMEAVPGISQVGATLTVRYLPGCNLAEIGEQAWGIPALTESDGSVRFYAQWGPYDPSDFPEYYNRIMEQTPIIGPVRFTFKADGYESDTLELVAEPYKAYHWHPRLVPDRSSPNPGLGPSDLLAGIEIHQEAPPPDTDRDGYADWLETHEGTNPNDAASHPAMGDANADGVTDARDATALARDASPPRDTALDVNQDNIVDDCDARVLYLWSIGSPPYDTLPLYPGPDPCPPSPTPP